MARIGFIYNTALYIKIKWEKVQNRKIENLKKMQSNFTRPKVCTISDIIHNLSSYHLTPEEEYALSFNNKIIGQHIQTKVSKNKIKREFESFFY